MMFCPRSLFLIAVGAIAACEPSAPEPAARLREGDIARVGSQTIDAEQVIAVAQAQQITKQAALSALTRDALFAEHFRNQRPRLAQFLESTVLARQLSEAFAAEALAAGEPTAAEVAKFTARNWWLMDRPAMTRVIHALVPFSSVQSGENKSRAKTVAEQLRQSLLNASTDAEFRSLAEAFPAQGFSIKVEALDPVAADGRAVNPESPPPPGAKPQTYAEAFARAAAAFESVGQISEVVETEFGYHILRSTELYPAVRPSFEERRRLLRDEIMDARAAKLQQTVLDGLRSSTRVDVELSAVTATEALQVQR